MSWTKTYYAKAFFEAHVPAIIKQLTRIANALEEQNERAITEDPNPSTLDPNVFPKRKLRKE